LGGLGQRKIDLIQLPLELVMDFVVKMSLHKQMKGFFRLMLQLLSFLGFGI
jgi:hypothetical protein